MSQRRTLILVAAIAIGALASFLVWNYVNNVEDTAFDNAEQVPVYLVKQGVPRGTSGLEAQAYIAKENIPKKFKPSNAITDPEDISGKIALNALVPNQVVVSDMFVDASDPNARPSFSDRLTKIRNQDQTAITVSVDQIHGVAGLIQPGDYVNVMVTSSVAAASDTEAAPQAAGVLSGNARYLYQKVEVLAVGQTALPEAGAAAEAASTDPAAAPTTESSGLITLIVPTKAAQYIASVPAGALYLVLVAADYKPVATEQIDPSAVIPGEDATAITPYGKEGPESGS